ncbi:5'-nucleotidase C-terminal domain-containing protein [Bacillus salitolerans]|uniref:5'-nucleotidase C-terminal domain-containing protein n=1 Tax=Bacillus salitolerans TaxID=1437434 RepID=A0ABW4LYA7_9BACI
MIRKTSKGIVSLALASALVIGAFAAPFSTSFVEAETETIKVQILGVNDLHGKMSEQYEEDINADGVKEIIGRMDYLATHIKEREALNPNTLLVNVGDMIGGSPFNSAAFQDEPIVEIMEAMGFDLGVLGNHEFDEGIAELQRMLKGGDHPNGKAGYDGMNFPVLAANAFDKSTGELITDPYHITEIGGAKIGFIGVVTTETPYIIVKNGNENLEVTDEVEAINKYTEELKSQGVKAIIVLAHNEASQDGTSATGDAADFANEVDDEVDVIFAAHNHQKVVATVDNKLIVQAYEYGKAFSDVDLEIDPTTGDIVKKTADVVYNTQAEVEADATVKAIIDSYDEKAKEKQAVVVGEAAADLLGGYGTFGLGDNALGNLIADGMMVAMDSDFALMNGGGIREDLPAGEITFGDLFNIQPFGNYLVKFPVTGAQLREILNKQISEKYGPDNSIAGFTYTWDRSTLQVVDMFLPDGSKVDEKAEYTVTVNNYMFGKYGAEFQGKETEGPTDVDATLEYVKLFDGPVYYEAEGRIAELSNRFTDLPINHWANQYVTDLFNLEVVKGTTETSFSPEKTLTRAQFASMITRTLGLTAEGAAPFADTKGLAATTQAEIAAAFEAGIIKGVSATEFQPNQSITRAQMVTMLMRAFKFETGVDFTDVETNGFNDVAGLDVEMAAAVYAAAELGYVSGYGDTFKPNNTASRAQAAKILSLYILN